MKEPNLKSLLPSGQSIEPGRKVHVLTSRRGQRFPDVVCAMACNVSYGPASVEKGVVPIKCDFGVMITKVTRAGRGTKTWTVRGNGKRLLEAIIERCRKRSCVWLWGQDLYRQLLAIGMFDQIGPGLPFTLGDDDGQEKESAEQAGIQQSNEGDGETGEAKKKARKHWTGFAVLEGRITILVCRLRGGGVLHCCDLANIGLGESGIPGADCEDRAEWALWRVSDWINWLRANDMGTLQHTISSQALYGFRKHLPAIPVLVHGDPRALGLERDALHGGRCEAFHLGKVKGPVYQLDFASLYGACAAQNDVPVLYNCFTENSSDLRKIPGIGYIADVTVDLDEPILPYRDFKENLLVFPIGKFRTCICGPEIDLVKGRIRKVHRAAAYQMAPLFHEWAEDCWRWRTSAGTQGMVFLEKQLKLFSQVIYGKFGQQQIGWRHVKCGKPPAPWSAWSQVDRESGQVDSYRSIAGRTEILRRGGETYDSCPAISAWITSLARVTLWKAILKIGMENVYYCDTDSIWTNSAGYNKAQVAGLVKQEALGGLRLVQCHKWVDFIGWKHYRTPAGIVCAGGVGSFGRGAGDPERATQPESIQDCCRLKRGPRKVELKRAGTRSREYRHGTVLGGLVYPFVMEP